MAALLCATAAVRAGDKAEPATLAGQAQSLVQESRSGKMAIGVSAVDLATGKTLLAIDDKDLYMPASNQKLVTSAAALALLGGDFKFTTNVYLNGKDVVVVGDYDPTLGDPVLAEAAKQDIYAELDKWAAAVKQKAGAKLDGDVIVVAPPGPYRHGDWPQGQYDRWYCAPVSTLNFNNNCMDIGFKVDKGVAYSLTTPNTPYITVENNVSVGKGIWTAKFSQGDSVLTLGGSVAGSSSQPNYVAVNNPPLLLGRAFAGRIAAAGVQIGGKVRAIDGKSFDASKATLLATTATPLGVAMARANKRSLNMVAECIFLRACGSWKDGPKQATAALAKAYGLDAELLTIADGSGMSRNNRVAPAGMTKMLAEVAKRKDAKVLFDSLPIVGTDGTMEKRLTQAPYKGRALAKTGFIDGVSCLSGYVLDEGGKPAIAFSVMVNHIAGTADAKRLEDGICQLLIDSMAKK